MTFEGRDFWNNIDRMLSERNCTLTDMCNKSGIAYNTVNGQRVRQSIPKLEQLLAMSQFLGTSIESIIMPNKQIESPHIKRIEAIRRACLIAPEEDLKLVERILRIDSSRSAKQFTFTESAKI